MDFIFLGLGIISPNRYPLLPNPSFDWIMGALVQKGARDMIDLFNRWLMYSFQGRSKWIKAIMGFDL